MVNNPYTILGVPNNTPIEECKKAYRKLAAKNHPDAGGSVKEFQKITKAWEDIQTGNVCIFEVKTKPHLSHITLFKYKKIE